MALWIDEDEGIRFPLTKVGPDAGGKFTIVDASGKVVAAKVMPVAADTFAAAYPMRFACEAFLRVQDEPNAENAMIRFCDAVRKIRSAVTKVKGDAREEA